LVVCTRATVWQRCIPIGGNAFTTAIAEAFKISFEKAEKLKRTAAMSKYARQIFQAMRPVFTDLASEIQRSLGFYNSSNPKTKLSKIIAFGGGTKMRGLLKYLQQTLQIPVEKPDSFKNLAIDSSVSSVKFHESVGDFGIVYGLGLQGLGLAKIESNLLPRGIARSMAWAGKAKYFIAAALMLLMASILCFARTYLDKVNYDNNDKIRRAVSNSNEAASQAIGRLRAEKNKGPGYDAIIEKEFELFKYRNVIPLLQQTIISTLPNEKNNPTQKELYQAFAEGEVEMVLKVPRKERKQLFITGMSVYFANDVETAKFGGGTLKKRKRKRKGGDSGGRRMMMPGSSRMMMPGQTESRFSMPGSGAKGKVSPKGIRKKGKKKSKKGKEVVERRTGFVVTITGYSPYKTIGELLDPAGVGNDPDNWGVVTRLLHLDDIADGNSPFKLYKKTEVEHFVLETGEVDFSSTKMPDGIGIEFEKTISGERGVRTERVLIDPMTKEVISKIAELDEDGEKRIDYATGDVVYKVNDRWFTLDIKFVWKDAPVTKVEGKGRK
jgi:type IV pilus assembly protein PilM